MFAAIAKKKRQKSAIKQINRLISNQTPGCNHLLYNIFILTQRKVNEKAADSNLATEEEKLGKKKPIY